jgi:hypothetical protein
MLRPYFRGSHTVSDCAVGDSDVCIRDVKSVLVYII